MENVDVKKIVAAYESRGSKTLAEVAKEHGVRPRTLSNWASRQKKSVVVVKSKKVSKLRSYTDEQKRKAVEACRNRGTASVREVAAKQGIPYGTLRDWFEGRNGVPAPLPSAPKKNGPTDAVRVVKEGLELLGLQIAKKVYEECTELGQSPAEFSKTFIESFNASDSNSKDERYEDLLKQNEKLSQDLRTLKVKIELILRVLGDMIKDID